MQTTILQHALQPQVVLGEKDAQLQRSNLHNEMLQEKAQVCVVW